MMVGGDLESWALTVMRDGVIGEREFSQELPRVGEMLRVYGQRNLYEVLVNMTTAGMKLTQVLSFLERYQHIRLHLSGLNKAL